MSIYCVVISELPCNLFEIIITVSDIRILETDRPIDCFEYLLSIPYYTNPKDLFFHSYKDKNDNYYYHYKYSIIVLVLFAE